MDCPKCGSMMVIRTARRGKNAGGTFWGCSKYPKCTETVDIDGDTSYIKDIKNQSLNYNKSYLMQFYATPLKSMYDMQAYQSIAIKGDVFSFLRNKIISKDVLLSNSRFRIDFSQSKYKLTREQEAICSLVLRFLCRGVISTNSTWIESEIDKLFPSKGDYVERNYYNCRVECSNDFPVSVDSEREEKFIKTYLIPILGPGWANHVVTQVNIASLIPKNSKGSSITESSQRVDFLISVNGNDYVIELDGLEHDSHKEKDQERDTLLRSNGYEVIRFKNEEIDMQNKHVNDILKTMLRKSEEVFVHEEYRNKSTIATKLVHQIQISIVSGMLKGVVSCNSDIKIIESSGYFTNSEISKLCKIVLKDLSILFDKFCFLYEVDNFSFFKNTKDSDVCICIGNFDVNSSPEIVISDLGFSRNISNYIPAVNVLKLKKHDIKTIEYFLEYAFRFREFKEGQYEGIDRLISRKDSIVLLPTGSGKSLIYQLTSLLIPGKIIVVSPLTSLMQDQLDNLYYFGIDCATAIYHGSNYDISAFDFSDPRITLVYLSPERLQVKDFRDNINNLLIKNSVFAVAVDEAHCVSEWGHDFRTAYLNIGRTSREVFRNKGENPVIIALTGTASTAVLKDVKRELEINDYDAIITPTTFDRSELHFSVFKSFSRAKQKQLEVVINEYIPNRFRQNHHRFYELKNDKSNSGIVFCPHVNGDYGVVNVASQLSTTASKSFYSGGAPKNYRGNWDKEKGEIATNFKSNKTNLLVATKAFGMGIDKPNIRFTVHYGIPGSIESFYQEAGRAGRDGSEAWCLILLSEDNDKIDQILLDPSTSLDRVNEIVEKINLEDNDDISRVLFFHTQAFKGVKYELDRVKEIVGYLFDEGKFSEKTIIVKCGEDDSPRSLASMQKALQRLLVLGVVFDYTVDYSAREIYVKPGLVDKVNISNCYSKYVKGYNEGRVASESSKLVNEMIKESKSKIYEIVAASKVLIEFIYDTIEKGRRRGLREMVRVAKAALESDNQDQVVRMHIVRYFESTYSEEIDSVIDSKNLGFDIIPIIFDGQTNDVGENVGGIRSVNEARGLRGQVSRYLESTPDHPGLLALRALSELYSKDYDSESIKVDFGAFIDFSINRYSCTEHHLNEFLVYILRKIFERDTNLYALLFEKIGEFINLGNFCSYILNSRELNDEIKNLPASIYFNEKSRFVVNTMINIKGD